MAELELPPLGIFDSGLGGLTVASEILRLSPAERLIYIGDTANVPYGPRSVAEVQQFSVGIARFLVEQRGCRAVVIACNTATSAAAEAVRAAVSVPVVAMEPGVKPAVAATRSGIIGVLATVGTLTGDRFAALVKEYAGNVRVLTQPCPGWVEAVESGEFDSDDTRALVRRYVEPLIAQGADTLSLGCTHYPLLRPLIAEVAGPDVTVLDTGEAVARRVLSVSRVGGEPISRDGMNSFAVEPSAVRPPDGMGSDVGGQSVYRPHPQAGNGNTSGVHPSGGRTAGGSTAKEFIPSRLMGSDTQSPPSDPGPWIPLHRPPTTDYRPPSQYPTGNPPLHIELLCTGDIRRFGSVARAILDRCGFADGVITLGHLTWKDGELHDDATN